MNDQDRPVATTDDGSSEADRILQYAHDRYARRKRLQRRSLSVVAVLAVAVAAVAVITRVNSSHEVRSIQPGGASAPRLSCRPASTRARVVPSNGPTNALVSVNAQRPFAGTGIVVSAGGEVLTASDAVGGGTGVTVRIGGRGPARTAHVVASDSQQGVTMLQIDHAANLPTPRVADPSRIAVGDAVVAIGNRRRSEGLVAERGTIVSYANRSHSLIETTVPIHPGDSGGPLLNARGELIGMVVGAGNAKTVRALPLPALDSVIAQLCSKVAG
jgi:S1-C subfamily serine protease